MLEGKCTQYGFNSSKVKNKFALFKINKHFLFSTFKGINNLKRQINIGNNKGNKHFNGLYLEVENGLRWVGYGIYHSMY